MLVRVRALASDESHYGFSFSVATYEPNDTEI